jgi:hypothetical protein
MLAAEMNELHVAHTHELQGGTMSRRTIITLVAAVATAAVFTGSASGMARADNGAYGTAPEMEWVSNGNGGVKAVPVLEASNIPYLSHGVGITREVPGITTEIPYLSHGVGITRQAPQQGMPIFRDTADGATLARGSSVDVSLASRDIADGATLARGSSVEVSLASSSSVDWSEVAMGFGFGLALALIGALSLLTLRNRTLRTQ